MNRRSFFQTSGLATVLSQLASNASAEAPLKAVHDGPVIRIGNIGCGGRGNFVSAIIAENPGFKITAAHDYFADSAATFGGKYGIAADQQFTGLDGYKKMLEQVDAVAIHSPPYFHVQQAIDAVAAGKHVLIAKPMAIDVKGCETIRQLAKDAAAKGIVVLADVQSRGNEHFQEGIKRIHDGALGDLMFGECHYEADLIPRNDDDSNPEGRLKNWVRHRDLGGDIITEQNIHALDIVSWAFGRPVRASGNCGRGARPDNIGDASDHFSLLFEFEKGAVTFSSRQFNGWGSPFACGNRFVGNKGIFTSEFGGRVMIRGDKESFWRGGDTKNLYRTGTEKNIETFRVAITSKNPNGNPTVEGAVESTLLTLFGEFAAKTPGGATWEEFMSKSQSANPDLSGLKA
ncbi:Gfo/Idh/MocA family oxidoreductase [Roseimicrobium sp. ORNL1]|uniref:Gfo/Idh/MocA family protein n=1 Tax=Roseimicrobium sp. ORNL1 TaxID=2711231 RepID=UPI0013E1E9D3|nr:Gfo/Idh/MocA family oxidoreductase [Roseimicrobium sp. ORNL1]QIF02713.1 Gfo/Idh/MocA family oxidoreductase [Roseimicrobium sp. ORNL1]